jgi:hypothetical protein
MSPRLLDAHKSVDDVKESIMQTISVVVLCALFTLARVNVAWSVSAHNLEDLGMGHVHMDISCSTAVSSDFDTGLAQLHNFWYSRAFSTFNQIIEADPECAIAYWGAAMTYNHPFWDAPTRADEQNA